MEVQEAQKSTISQEQIEALVKENRMGQFYGRLFVDSFALAKKRSLELMVTEMQNLNLSKDAIRNTRMWNEMERIYEHKKINAPQLEKRIKQIEKENYQPLIETAKKQNERLEKMKNNAQNLHEDIKIFYMQKHGQENIIRTTHLEEINPKKIKLLEKIILKNNDIDPVLDYALFNEVQDSINEKMKQGESGVKVAKEYLNQALNALWVANNFDGYSTTIQDVLEPNKRVRIVKNGSIKEKRYFAMTAMAAEKLMQQITKSNHIQLFSQSMESLESYYSKEDINLQCLEQALDSNTYSFDEEWGEIRTSCKMKQGNKREKKKINAVIKVKDDQLTLKYMTSGVFGKKIDVVLQYENGQIKEVKHIEYTNQERLKVGPDLEFKSYAGHKKSLNIEGNYQEFNSKRNIITEDILDDNLTNPFYIGEGAKRRLNLAAIGGEALLHAHDFIKKNYEQIIGAANNYKTHLN